MQIYYKNKRKYIVSKNYNCIVDKVNNFFIRCGNTLSEVPSSGELEYIEIEISNIYDKNNKFFFKRENENKIYMKFKTFRKILDILPKSLNHINFTGDPECKNNPDIWKILYYCKIKNITTSIICGNISKNVAKKLSKYCKSVFFILSNKNKNNIYENIKYFTTKNILVNLCILVCKECHHLIITSLYNYKNDKRLKNINSIYFIGLKPIENWRFLNKIEIKDFIKIVDYMKIEKIPYGFDNMLSPIFIKENTNKIKEYYHNMIINQCESFTFNLFIDVFGFIYPCKYYNDFFKIIKTSIFELKEFKNYWNSNFIKNFNKNNIIVDKKNIRYCSIYKF